MTLEELLVKAFARGCGIGMTEAMEAKHYQDLVAECSDHPYPEQAAQVQLLGEHLIDAAFDCLPDAIQMFARTWNDMTAEQQLDTLRPMCDSLASDMWYFHHKLERPDQYEQTAADVLPREFGPWETGAVCPSCMGMGTLLMAFAKRTGAPYWLVHVNKSIMYEIQGLHLDILSAVLGFLKRRLPMASDAGEFKIHDELVEDVLNAIVSLNKYNFHPAMVIRLKDDRWVLVDPYFGTLAVLDEPEWPIAEATDIMSRPDSRYGTVLMGSRKAIFRYREQLAQESGHLAGYLETVMEHVVEAQCDVSTLVAAVAVLRELVEHVSLSFMKPLVEGLSDEQLYAQGMFEHRAEVTPVMARQGMDRLEIDPQYARLSVERMLAFVFTLWIQRVSDDLKRMSRTVPHSSLELTDPVTGIAVGTLNNLRCYDGSRPQSVGGVLVLFCRAQSIWHDSMLDVRGCTQVPELIAKTLVRLEVLLAAEPKEYLHPHVARMVAARQEQGGAEWQLPES